jgi:hypothetical protein
MKKRFQWAPYLLILPSLIFLAVFFAWPMFQALALSVWDSRGALTLRDEPEPGSPALQRLPMGSTVTILDRQGNFMTREEVGEAGLLTEDWYRVRGEGLDGQVVEGWAPDSRIRVREEDDAGVPTAGTVRRILLTTVDPETTIYEEPNDNSAVVGQMEPNTEVAILEVVTLAVWFHIEGTGENEGISGWVPSHLYSSLRRRRNRPHPARQCWGIHDGVSAAHVQRPLLHSITNHNPAADGTDPAGAVCARHHHGPGCTGAIERQ